MSLDLAPTVCFIKEGYETVRFDINESDADNGIVLYIASPPDSVEGDNDSGPGEY